MNNPLNCWNDHWSKRLSPNVCGLIAGLITCLCFVLYLQSRGWLEAVPSTLGDEPNYDSIGWELSNGRGFQLDYTDPGFREFYDRTKNPGGPLRSFTPNDGIPDTTRPPLFPLLLAVNDSLAGRQLWGIRLWNILSMSLICGLAVRFVAQRFGALPGLLVIPMFVLLDVRTRLYARAILTEATAALFVTLLGLALITLLRDSHPTPSSRSFRFLTCCCLLVLGMYTRTNLIVWVPVLSILMSVAVFRASRKHRLLNAGVIVIIFANVVGIGYLPWAIRNMSVTGEFLPTGTQGSMELSAAYGDAIWESHGVWTNLDALGFFDEVESAGLSPMAARIAKARYSQQTAWTWIVDHPGKTVLLFPMKIYQEFRPHRISEAIILVLSVIGLFALGRSVERSVFLTLIAACAFGIGLTWSVEGRFLVPLLFVWQTTAAIGMWWLVCRVTRANPKPAEELPISTTGQNPPAVG